MGKDEAIVVPVIDLANFPAELEKIGAASSEVGCFRIINHGMPLSLLAEMKETTRSLFNLPDETKLRNVINNLDDAGYRPLNFSHQNPLYESFGIYDASSPTDVDVFCSLLDASPHQTKVITDYFAKLHGLAMDVASKIAHSLGLADYSFKGWCCQARLISYHFKFQEDIGSIGTPIHTDSSFLTVLQDDESVGGLELIDANGNFLSVDTLPGSLFVNVGDIGKVWSNGKLHNAKHRVVCKKAMPRISIALFLVAPKDGHIEAQAAFINSDHPKLYPNFIYNDYRKQRSLLNLREGELVLGVKNAEN